MNMVGKHLDLAQVSLSVGASQMEGCIPVRMHPS